MEPSGALAGARARWEEAERAEQRGEETRVARVRDVREPRGGDAPQSAPVRDPRGGDAPLVAHVREAATAGLPGDAIAVALDAVARQFRPHAASFFAVGADGELTASFVHGADPGAAAVVARWKRELDGVDPLAPRALAGAPRTLVTFADVGAAGERLPAVYRRLGVVNDARLLVRDDERVVGGLTLWRPLRGRAWSRRELELLDALQPFVERAYVEAARAAPRDPGAKAGLTPREREVARLIAAGATNAEVARALHIGAETAKSHTSAILAKLGLASRRDVMLLHRAPRRPEGPGAREDAATAARLLSALLRWARLRLGAGAGGWAVLSGRGTVLAGAAHGAAPLDAGAAASRGAAHGDAGAAHGALPLDAGAVAAHGASHGDAGAAAVHEALLTPAFLRQVTAGSMAADVFAAAAVHPHPERLRALASRGGWTAPLVLVVRLHGRVAGIGWIARDRVPGEDDDARAALAALNAIAPLVAAACGPLVRRALARPAPADDPIFARLTRRERAVARAALAGATNAEIARQLQISEATVKTHMTRVLAKCGARSRAQLIALARAR